MGKLKMSGNLCWWTSTCKLLANKAVDYVVFLLHFMDSKLHYLTNKIMRGFVICSVKKCYCDDERKECEVGETCNMHGEIKKLIYDHSRKIWMQCIRGKIESRWIILKLFLVKLGARM
jgi:hypothetical protein